MDALRRRLLSLAGVAIAGLPLLRVKPIRAGIASSKTSGHAVDDAFDMRFMRLAVKEAAKNPRYPFGAVIVRHSNGEVLASGANRTFENVMFHGEIVAMNNLVARHGNEMWPHVAIYTTGEPCPMCMGALAWAGVPHVFWGSSMATISSSGINQCELSALQVAASASSFYRPTSLAGGILADETDRLFSARRLLANPH